MKTLMILLSLSFTQPKPQPQKQTGFWWKQAGIVTLNIVSGFAMYQNEITTHNWFLYQQRHPQANQQWWWPRLSTNNKYKNGDPAQGPKFPGSTTVLVGFTDKYHFKRMLRNAFVAGSTAISMTLWHRPRWQQVLLQMVVNWAAYAIGTGIGHAVYYKY